MPIELPDLDNRTYADLASEAVTSIPDLHPGWTDHNPSNPGIALIELLSWLTEMVLYRTNQIPQRNYEVFLKLLNGPTWELPAGQDLEAAIRDTLKSLRERYRAVTADDYEYLVANTWPGSAEAAALDAQAPPTKRSTINRSHCLPEYNINLPGNEAGARGYITLLVVPGPPQDPWLSQLDPDLVAALQSFFKDRRVLTTLLHVTAPVFLVVDISVTIFLKDDADHNDVNTNATQALVDFFHPCSGGVDGRGWPFGGAVHASDVYTVLDKVRGVDYVDLFLVNNAPAKIISSDPTREVTDQGNVTAIKLMPWELANVQAQNIHLAMKERRGDQWVLIS